LPVAARERARIVDRDEVVMAAAQPQPDVGAE
jgi:hypothetical protein